MRFCNDLKLMTLLGLCLTLLVACSTGDPAKDRANHLLKSKDDIVLGAVWPWKSRWKNMGKGIDLAVSQINEAGGVMGKKLKVIPRDDEASVNKGMIIAQEFADNPNVVAVIGHINSYISIPASATYQFAGILMFTPGSNATKLTDQGFDYVFRGVPSNQQIGKYLVGYARSQGYKNIMIYYIGDEYGRDTANHFEKNAYFNDINIVDRRSYFAFNDDYLEVLETWQTLHKFDAIFLIGPLPTSGTIIKKARALGLDVPIFGGTAMDTIELINVAGKASEGTAVISMYFANDPRPENKAFYTAYMQRYGEPPDTGAAMGYDSVTVLVEAIEQGKSIVPADIAKTMRKLESHTGVTGLFTFDKKGDRINQSIRLKVVRDGKFEYMPIIVFSETNGANP